MLKSREITEQVDWRAKQPPHVACVSRDLKCDGLQTPLVEQTPLQGHQIISNTSGGQRRRKAAVDDLSRLIKSRERVWEKIVSMGKNLYSSNPDQRGDIAPFVCAN